MFYFAYNGYVHHAYPHDELRPLTCDGVNTWGNYSLTLVDALDTLGVMGNNTEFQRVANVVAETLNPNKDVNVSVFETNIRVIGGLLSAHLMSRHMGVAVEDDWPCNGPLLRLAERFAQKLLPAFNTPTGMPYGTVNLLHGVDPNETPETCTAAVGTYIVEFGTLSRLTGKSIYENKAMRAMFSLHSMASKIGLVGNHINVLTGVWTAVDSGVGAGVDSYFEYMVKGANLLRNTDLMTMFKKHMPSIEKYIKQGDWYMWVNMKSGAVTMPIFQSLEAFWPGLQTMVGDIENAYKTLLNYFEVWNQFGMTPEFYSITQKAPYKLREGYPLRPELIESILYVYKATKDPLLLQMGKQILHAIETTAKTECGYATIKDVRDHTLENRMESFFLAETTKYLYLLFDPDNFLHNTGKQGHVVTMKDGSKCVVEAGGYIFNTEAHPMGPAALHCCHKRHVDVEEITQFIKDLDENSYSERTSKLKYNHKRKRKFKHNVWKNKTIVNNDSRLVCPAPPHHLRLNMYGEVYVGD
uniref:ER degradation-enhancing alpha-mannosidase-like protein 2 n=1 Tax=Styela clava TaxID=7725 RepID=UPI001939819C|nr:ER degradation-enhancing alpha-mannosidase-like protein 2 [Styela clava]